MTYLGTRPPTVDEWEQYELHHRSRMSIKGYLGYIISFMIPSVLRAQEKGKVLKATIKGIKEGLHSDPIEWSK